MLSRVRLKVGNRKMAKFAPKRRLGKPASRDKNTKNQAKKAALVVSKGTKTARHSGQGMVFEKRVYDQAGRLRTVLTVDTRSKTFGSDLQYAFEKNVAKARRENKKLVGRA